MSEPASTAGRTTAQEGKDSRVTFSNLRALWAIDERAWIVRSAQTVPGKLMLVGVFAGLAMGAMQWIPTAAILVAAACAYMPRYRSWIVALAALGALMRRPYHGLDDIGTLLARDGLSPTIASPLATAALVLFFGCAWGALALARRHKDLLLVRRPVMTLLMLEGVICTLACSPLVHGVSRAALWAFLCVLTSYTWFLAYGLMDQRSRSRGPLLFQMGILQPFWGSSSVPYGKGAALLRKHEAKTPADLAVTQLKALKLLGWAAMLLALDKAMAWIGQSLLHIPSPESAMTAFLHGRPYPIAANWCSLFWTVLRDTVETAVYGHQIIALARLAGYRLPRNTWRPLESRTLAEFWNRYYYYFKELLVEFFFFPTFLKVFRNRPRLRVFFATFMAAGVGNAIFHFMRDIKYVVSMGLQGAVESYASYMFYCAALAVGIGISQARTNAGRKLPTRFGGILWSILCVWTVVACLRVFADESRAIALRDRFHFAFSLFGISS